MRFTISNDADTGIVDMTPVVNDGTNVPFVFDGDKLESP
jgi:hypothetical protein